MSYFQESGLYYLQSRYYNPEVGRFLNADVEFDTDTGLQGYNILIYCGNSPVNRIDVSGRASYDCVRDDDALDGEYVKNDGGGGNAQNSGIASGSQLYFGYGHAPKQGPAGSTYTQYSSDGKQSVVSQTTYNEYCVPERRIDYQGRDHGVGLPHVHVYSWDVRNGSVVRTGEYVSLYRMQ